MAGHWGFGANIFMQNYLQALQAGDKHRANQIAEQYYSLMMQQMRQQQQERQHQQQLMTQGMGQPGQQGQGGQPLIQPYPQIGGGQDQQSAVTSSYGPIYGGGGQGPIGGQNMPQGQGQQLGFMSMANPFGLSGAGGPATPNAQPGAGMFGSAQQLNNPYMFLQGQQPQLNYGG